MRKLIAALLGAVAAAGMMTGNAAADKGNPDSDVYIVKGFGQFTRPCGTSYAMTVTRTKAVAGKGSNGSCAGHVWMRVLGDSWGAWTHSNTEVTRTSPKGKFRQAQFKGCNESYCVTYTVSV